MNDPRLEAGCLGCGTLAEVSPKQGETTATAPQQPDLLLESSPEAADKMALQTAVEKCKAAVAEKPDCAWAWYHYGDALLGLRRAKEAVPVLRKALELSPEPLVFHYALGLALFDLDQVEAARDEFAGVVAQDPKLQCVWSSLMPGALMNLALSQEKLGQREEAIQTLLPALDDAVAILINLAFLHFRAKHHELSLPYIHAAYLLRPNNGDVLHQYGATLNVLKRGREAVKILEKATELKPTCDSAWYDLGLAYARVNHLKQARRCFLKSLNIDPRRAWSYYDLACLDAREGKRNAAFKHLQQAMELGFRDSGYLRRDADFRSLRRDVRWKSLIKNLRDLAYSNN